MDDLPAAAMLDSNWFRLFHQRGYNVRESVLPRDLCAAISTDVLRGAEAERAVAGERYRNGVVTLPFRYRASLSDEIINKEILWPVDRILGDNILYLFMSSFMSPGEGNYSSVIHRDVNSATPADRVVFVGMLVLLSDFQKENGGTVLFPGSHLDGLCLPDETSQGECLTLPAGSVIYFDGRLAHKGGVNHSTSTRGCLALGFCRDFMTPRFDFPALLENDEKLNIYQKKKYGFRNRPPGSLDEFLLRSGS